MRHRIILFAAGAAALLSGCATDRPSTNEAEAAANMPQEAATAPGAGAPQRCEPCGDGPVALLAPDTAAFATAISPRLKAARYMQQNCAPTTFPGWERYPLIECAYSLRNADGSERSAKVIMLNPDEEQLARWIFYTCRKIGKDNAACREKLLRQVLTASGGQFPVAGVVLEDISPADGAYESYTFRTGVTVKLAGVPNGGTRQLTDAEIAAAESPDAAVTSSRRYARLQSTSPDQFRADGGDDAVGTTAAPSLEWPVRVGALYRAAWGANENRLMIAWARAHAADF